LRELWSKAERGCGVGEKRERRNKDGGRNIKGCMCVKGEQQEATSMVCTMNEEGKKQINILAVPSKVNGYKLDSL